MRDVVLFDGGPAVHRAFYLVGLAWMGLAATRADGAQRSWKFRASVFYSQTSEISYPGRPPLVPLDLVLSMTGDWTVTEERSDRLRIKLDTQGLRWHVIFSTPEANEEAPFSRLSGPAHPLKLEFILSPAGLRLVSDPRDLLDSSLAKRTEAKYTLLSLTRLRYRLESVALQVLHEFLPPEAPSPYRKPLPWSFSLEGPEGHLRGRFGIGFEPWKEWRETGVSLSRGSIWYDSGNGKKEKLPLETSRSRLQRGEECRIEWESYMHYPIKASGYVLGDNRMLKVEFLAYRTAVAKPGAAIPPPLPPAKGLHTGQLLLVDTGRQLEVRSMEGQSFGGQKSAGSGVLACRVKEVGSTMTFEGVFMQGSLSRYEEFHTTQAKLYRSPAVHHALGLQGVELTLHLGKEKPQIEIDSRSLRAALLQAKRHRPGAAWAEAALVRWLEEALWGWYALEADGPPKAPLLDIEYRTAAGSRAGRFQASYDPALPSPVPQQGQDAIQTPRHPLRWSLTGRVKGAGSTAQREPEGVKTERREQFPRLPSASAGLQVDHPQGDGEDKLRVQIRYGAFLRPRTIIGSVIHKP